MNPEEINVGIAYNEYVSPETKKIEKLSEETVKDMAMDVFHQISQFGYQPKLVPLANDLYEFMHKITDQKLDVVINLCEGYKDRPFMEFCVASLLELMAVRYTGNPARTLGMCQNKYQTKLMLRGAGLPVAKGELVTTPDEITFKQFPAIVKPNNEDASLGIYPHSVVRTPEELEIQVRQVLATYNQPALVEQYIAGREFNVAVMEVEAPMALPVSEIDFSKVPEGYPHICSYEAKWFEGHVLFDTTVPICPAKLSAAKQKQLQTLATKAFRLMGCRDYARVDFRMNKQGRPYILEVNPNPDISLNAGYARGLRAAGIDYSEFWDRIIRKTYQRNR